MTTAITATACVLVAALCWDFGRRWIEHRVTLARLEADETAARVAKLEDAVAHLKEQLRGVQNATFGRRGG